MGAARDEAHDSPAERSPERDAHSSGAPESSLTEDNDAPTLDTDLLPTIAEPDGARQAEGISSPIAPPQTPSIDGSLSTPDDAPSLLDSKLSSPGRRGKTRSPRYAFDHRFQSRLSLSPVGSSRPISPGFLSARSRQSSLASAQFSHLESADSESDPTEPARWIKLRKLSGEAYSEVGRRIYGRPTCFAVASFIALGTSKGIILIFDSHQALKATIGVGTKAVECGAITAIALAADHSTVAGGHADGSIFTWEIKSPAKPFLHIPPLPQVPPAGTDGHIHGVKILHLGFLGTRHTALVSADDRGMAFSNLASRGMGPLARAVHSKRILGRYPDAGIARSRKPSSVLAFSPLPLGNVETPIDGMGLTALLTPYLLVVVSTTPVAETQFKMPRPKDVAAHGALSAALAWYPPMRVGKGLDTATVSASKAKLAYCWLDVLMVLEVEGTEDGENDRPPELHFHPRRRWRANESIVAIQWISRSVLAVITLTQKLLILEDDTMRLTLSCDLMPRHIYHADLFSQQLRSLVEKLDDDDASMHGVTADAFYMSFRAYKGRLYLLGYNDFAIGSLANWADHLLAMMEDGDFIAAIRTATSYYAGDTDKATLALPSDDESRHQLVRDKLTEMMHASLKYAFGKNREAETDRLSEVQLEELCRACFEACLTLDDLDFLFDDVFSWYEDGHATRSFLRVLETYISDQVIRSVPPIILKALVIDFVRREQQRELEVILCRLDPSSMDLDQITALSKEYQLYDALLYVWSRAMDDYTTVLKGLLDQSGQPSEEASVDGEAADESVLRVFPYLSYILTGRIYPTGERLPEAAALKAKAEIYHLFFSGSGSQDGAQESFHYLRAIFDLEAASFMRALNEAFEDSFLNDTSDLTNGDASHTELTDEQRFGLSLNRQYVVSILLEVLKPPNYQAESIIFLDMFIARNLAKFPQFILLPGHVLQRIFVELCSFPSDDLAEDCQLSVEYLLSVFQPPDLSSLIPLLTRARFFRVIKSIYRNEHQYARLLQVCFEDVDTPDDVFECLAECLGAGSRLNERQQTDFRRTLSSNFGPLTAAGIERAATAIDRYAPDMHKSLIEFLGTDEQAQYQYLRQILEVTPPSERTRPFTVPSDFVERYIRLLCEYDRGHVGAYVDALPSSQLHLEAVLPVLESSGAIDAAVVLLARDGKVVDAMERLLQHLATLQTALETLLQASLATLTGDTPPDATDDICSSIEKYTRLGIWLCRGQTQASAATSREVEKKAKRRSRASLPAPRELAPHEQLWLDLIDMIVRITQDAAETVSTKSNYETAASDMDVDKQALQSAVLGRLRRLVQDTFSALLSSTAINTTSTSGAKASTSALADASSSSFLPIFRALLNRLTTSLPPHKGRKSLPSLSQLRGVLQSVLAAYTYEEGLLELANRMLEQDLFVHVQTIVDRRKRGWRPLGQLCSGCGLRVWGPGAGQGIWQAWLEQEIKDERGRASQMETRAAARIEGSSASRQRSTATSRGKGKDAARARSTSRKAGDATAAPLSKSAAPDSQGVDRQSSNVEAVAKPSDAVVVFSCRHLWHRQCLEAVDSASTSVSAGPVSAGQPVAGSSTSTDGVSTSCKPDKESSSGRYRCPLEVGPGSREGQETDIDSDAT